MPGGEWGAGGEPAGRRKQRPPPGHRGASSEHRSPGRSSYSSETERFPNKKSIRKLDFMKMQFVASFSKGTMLSLLVWWLAVSGKLALANKLQMLTQASLGDHMN